MSNLETKRHIDALKDEISCAIAHSELIHAQKLYSNLCDLVECDGYPWDDEAIAYWNAAIETASAWLCNAQQIEGEIAEYLHFEQTPHRPQGLHHENIGDALAAFPLDFGILPEIPFEAGGSATRMIEPDDGMYGDEYFDNLFDSHEQILHRGELELGL